MIFDVYLRLKLGPLYRRDRRRPTMGGRPTKPAKIMDIAFLASFKAAYFRTSHNPLTASASTLLCFRIFPCWNWILSDSLANRLRRYVLFIFTYLCFMYFQVDIYFARYTLISDYFLIIQSDPGLYIISTYIVIILQNVDI